MFILNILTVLDYKNRAYNNIKGYCHKSRK